MGNTAVVLPARQDAGLIRTGGCQSGATATGRWRHSAESDHARGMFKPGGKAPCLRRPRPGRDLRLVVTFDGPATRSTNLSARPPAGGCLDQPGRSASYSSFETFCGVEHVRGPPCRYSACPGVRPEALPAGLVGYPQAVGRRDHLLRQHWAACRVLQRAGAEGGRWRRLVKSSRLGWNIAISN